MLKVESSAGYSRAEARRHERLICELEDQRFQDRGDGARALAGAEIVVELGCVRCGALFVRWFGLGGPGPASPRVNGR